MNLTLTVEVTETGPNPNWPYIARVRYWPEDGGEVEQEYGCGQTPAKAIDHAVTDMLAVLPAELTKAS